MGSVPVWLAISGTGVGLVLGSFNIFEKIVTFFRSDPIEISERYLVVSIPIDGAGNSLGRLLDQLGSLGTFLPQASNGLPEKISKEALELIENDYCSKSFSASGSDCRLTEVFISFYGVTNNDKRPIKKASVSFSGFENGEGFHADEEQGAIIGELVGKDGSVGCFWTTISMIGSGECYSFLVDEEIGEVSVAPVQTGETVLFPIYFGYSFDNDINGTSETVIDKRFNLPNSVVLNDRQEFDARKMGYVPTIRGPYIEERG